VTMNRVAINFLFVTICFAFKVEAKRPFRPPDLKSSKELITVQNFKADRLNLSQISESNLSWFKENGHLVFLPRDTSHFYIASGHVPNRYLLARPWVKEYIVILSAAYYEQFKKKLKITSAARTIERQRRLARVNRNAVPHKGAHASLHMRGIVFDVSRKGMGVKERDWMRQRLLEDKFKGIETGVGIIYIDPTEESYCYHIVVFPKDRLPD